MGLTADVQTLTPGAWVELFELDATAVGAELYRFHGYAQEGPIVWQGKEYSPWPIHAEGFDMDGQGNGSNPTLRVGNVGGFIGALCQAFDDLVGARLTRRRTLTKYLDAINFPAGNPTADPNEEAPPDLYDIEQRPEETPEVVTFTLTSPLNFNGVQLPRRQIVANVCSWLAIGGYRGPYCGYNGPPVANADDVIVTDAALDRCGGRLTSCKMRFGANNELPFGSFPAAALVKA